MFYLEVPPFLFGRVVLGSFGPFALTTRPRLLDSSALAGEPGPDQVSITVYDGDEEEFYYAVRARTFRNATFAFPEMTFKDDEKDAHHRAMVYTREGAQDYGIICYEKEQVIANFMHEYDRQLRWQKPTKSGS